MPEERSQMHSICCYFLLFFRGDHIEPMVLEDWERVHSNKGQNPYGPLSITKKIGGQLVSLPYPSSPETPNQSFETGIWYNMVERFYKYSFGDDKTPIVPGERAVSYAIFPSTHCISYWETYGIFFSFFLGRGEYSAREEDFPHGPEFSWVGSLLWGGKFPGVFTGSFRGGGGGKGISWHDLK